MVMIVKQTKERKIMRKNLFVFIHGVIGNGVEDDGHGVIAVKIFNERENAIIYSNKVLKEIVNSLVEIVEQDESSLEEAVKELNGYMVKEDGNWEIKPESTYYGMVKEETE